MGTIVKSSTDKAAEGEELVPPSFIFCAQDTVNLLSPRGRSDGAMVLGKLPVLGRPASLDYSRARAFCAFSGCGWGLFGHFFSHLSFLFFLPFSGRRPDIDWNTVSKGR